MSKFDNIVLKLNAKWGEEDFRSLKKELMMSAQESLKAFSVLSNNNYVNNPIQVFDLFCGAGGTSLGFAAINRIIPAFNY